MFHSKHPNDLVLFDIRLRSSYKDTVLFQGPETDTPSTPLHGLVVCSLASPIAVKKVSLRLVGTFKLEFFEVLQDLSNSGQQHSIPVKEDKTVFECVWDNLLVNPNGVVTVLNCEGVPGAGSTSQDHTASGSRNDSDQVVPPLASAAATGNPNSSSLVQGEEPQRRPVFGRNQSMSSLNQSMSSLNLGKMSKNLLRSYNSSSNLITLSDSSSILGTPFQDLTKLKDESLDSKSFMLPQGNYELPFTAILPGNLAETVEGLKGGSILYKFQATIIKATTYQPSLKFFLPGAHNNSKIVKNRYIRVFRTLPTESLLIPQELSISNVWPSKIQYMVETPSKYIAIGLKFPVTIKLIPLMKNLKLGKISLSITEYYAFKGKRNAIYDDSQRVLYKSVVPEPSEAAPSNEGSSGLELGEPLRRLASRIDNRESRPDVTDNINISDPDTTISIGQASWHITTFVQVPSHLKDVTQDCDMQTDLIKVRHKLKVKVSLINPDKHRSELRANLPIILFINPSVKLFGRHVVMDDSGKTHFRSLADQLFNTGAHSIGNSAVDLAILAEMDQENSPICSPHSTSFGNSISTLSEMPALSQNHAASLSFALISHSSSQMILDDLAPPHYDSHVYDRVYNPNNNTVSSAQVSSNNDGANTDASTTHSLASSSTTRSGASDANRSNANSNGNTSQHSSNQNISINSADAVLQLHTRRANFNTSSPSSPSPSQHNLDHSQQLPHRQNSSATSIAAGAASPRTQVSSPNQGLATPPITSHNAFLRGAPGAEIIPPSSPLKNLSIDELSKVPSYSQAVEEYAAGNISSTDLAPLYERSRATMGRNEHGSNRPSPRMDSARNNNEC